MDNNIPFYPLLHPQRSVDVILAIDSSADIQTMPYFERAEGYVRRRGIAGWPTGSGWPREEPQDGEGVPENLKDDLESEQKKRSGNGKYGLGLVNVFQSAATEGEETHKLVLVYMPLLPNCNYERNPTFDPQVAEYCSTWNFVYSPEQVGELAGLGEANWVESAETIRTCLREVWEKKRKARRGW